MVNILNMETINCIFRCGDKCCVDAKQLQYSLIELENLAKTTDQFTFINMFMGRIVALTNSNVGFIYKAIMTQTTSYKALASFGLSVNESILTKNILNIPLHYQGAFVGTLGLGLPSRRINLDAFLDQLEGLIGLLSRYIYEHEF
jgi:hypothetical protein